MMKFENQSKSKEQAMAELISKKIFEEFTVVNQNIEYVPAIKSMYIFTKKKQKLIVKCRDRY